MVYYSNAIIRYPRKIKQFIKMNDKNQEEIEKIQEKLDRMNWTDENSEQRKRLYRELGDVYDLFRNNRIRIQKFQREFLDYNITG